MTRTADVVDAVVVTIALRQKAMILTSDPDDIERLVRASGREAAVVTPKIYSENDHLRIRRQRVRSPLRQAGFSGSTV